MAVKTSSVDRDCEKRVLYYILTHTAVSRIIYLLQQEEETGPATRANRSLRTQSRGIPREEKQVAATQRDGRL